MPGRPRGRECEHFERQVWCWWRPSSAHRRDGAAVAQDHDELGQPCSTYWLAHPPWIGTLKEAAEVFRRRFKTPLAAMDYADRTWPPESTEAPG